MVGDFRIMLHTPRTTMYADCTPNKSTIFLIINHVTRLYAVQSETDSKNSSSSCSWVETKKDELPVVLPARILSTINQILLHFSLFMPLDTGCVFMGMWRCSSSLCLCEFVYLLGAVLFRVFRFIIRTPTHTHSHEDE